VEHNTVNTIRLAQYGKHNAVNTTPLPFKIFWTYNVYNVDWYGLCSLVYVCLYTFAKHNHLQGYKYK